MPSRLDASPYVMLSAGKSRRRRYQFSLRSLLIVITGCALLLGLAAHHERKQRTALVAVRALGGRVFYNFDAPAWLNQRLGDDWFSSVVAVDLAFTDVTDDHLNKLAEDLKRLPLLSWVRLSGTRVSLAGARGLCEALPNVKVYHTPGVPQRLVNRRDSIPMQWGETAIRPDH